MKELIKKFIPSFLLSWYHFLLAFSGALIYGFPSNGIKVIGVTGTNGKTTVVNLITRILEEAGFKVASLSSIKFKVDKEEKPNTLKMTMPGRFKLQRFFRKAVAAKCQYVVLEVTSEGIKQHRHRFIKFNTTVFTNLTPEHIEAHGGFENYRKTKGKLFRAVKDTHIINLDDENTEYFLKIPANKKIGYTIESSSNHRVTELIRGTNTETSSRGIDFTVKDIPIHLNILGRFNIYNALAAISVGLSQGIDLETCKKGLERVEGIPGRMELVINSPFNVFVDYAFTPNALEQVYQTLKSEGNRIIAVLGACGGGRDKWKRPILGEIAAKHSHKVIITNEDPYDEDPMKIINQVAKGTNGKGEKILDRREAIKQALNYAQAGDVVVITGKGCETWICVRGGKKIAWDDRRVVREEFKKLSL